MKYILWKQVNQKDLSFWWKRLFVQQNIQAHNAIWKSNRESWDTLFPSFYLCLPEFRSEVSVWRILIKRIGIVLWTYFASSNQEGHDSDCASCKNKIEDEALATNCKHPISPLFPLLFLCCFQINLINELTVMACFYS